MQQSGRLRGPLQPMRLWVRLPSERVWTLNLAILAGCVVKIAHMTIALVRFFAPIVGYRLRGVARSAPQPCRRRLSSVMLAVPI